MFTIASECIAVVLLALGCHAPAASAQSASSTADRLHANAVASFRQARLPELARQPVPTMVASVNLQTPIRVASRTR